MKKLFLFLLLLLPGVGFAQTPGTDSDAFGFLSDLNRENSEQLSIQLSGDALIITRNDKDPYDVAYKNGDVVFLHGHLEDDWTRNEWARYYGVATWLVNHDFRIIMNPKARLHDIQASVQDPRTKAIIWSSHGSSNGIIYDFDNKPVPTNVFSENAGANFRQIIVSACYGDVMQKTYTFPAGKFSTIYWSGTTSADDLFAYLINKWDPLKL